MNANIYDYTDYKSFLKEWYDAKKTENPNWSYRVMAQKLNIKSAGQISNVVTGDAKLSPAHLDKFATFFGFDEFQKSYLQALVDYYHAEDADKEECYEKLLECQEPNTDLIPTEQLQYFKNWYYSAIRESLELLEFKGDNYEVISDFLRPKISIEQAKEGVAFLQEHGLISEHEGGWRATQAQITASNPRTTQIFDNHITQVLKLAVGALKRIPKGRKYNSWVTMSLSNDAYQKIIQELRNTKRRILKIVELDKQPVKVCHLNLNLFPITTDIDKQAKKG